MATTSRIAGVLNELRNNPLHNLVASEDRQRLLELVTDYFDEPVNTSDDESSSGKQIHEELPV